MSKNIFIERIEQQRIKLNLSQSEMAYKLGMSPSSYKRLINGETSTKMFDVAIKFYYLTGTSIFGYDTNISKQHILLSKMSGMTDDELNFVEYIIDYIKKIRVD